MRGSRTVLREAAGETPAAYSPFDVRLDTDPTPKELREMAAAALPDPAYLADLRRFGDRPSPEIIERGWEQFDYF